ncbi:MAG TPA: AAA family ATPase, partial [Candidatus Binataceae bacterium]|nr:AAA family ATPase [Candidatus Binataceae bacterium]
MIEGEPGIGKSRLAVEFATRARRRDVRVLWAMCDTGAESAPPLWPWIQIAHQQARDGNRTEPGANAIANGAQPGNVPMLANVALEPDGAPGMRLARVSRAAIEMLAEAARAKPLVLIFEDAERTDALSLELIAAVAAELHEALVIVSCYAAALRHSSALRKAFTNPVFNRARWIQLRRFDEEELMRLVEARARFSPEPGTLGAIKRMSGGNPGFVEMVVDSELMSVSDDPFKGARLMPVARIAVERYLRPFSQEVRSVLRIAATIGSEFELRVLAQVCAELQGQAADIADIVEEAEAAGVIRPVRNRPGLYAFAHALVREALREETPRRESIHLHKRIGLALLNAHTLEKEYLGDIATHLFRGAAHDGGDPKPTRYCERAAEYAEKMRDFAAAARFYRMALATLDLGASGASNRRCDLLLALGRVESRSGDGGAGSRSLASAAELAELNRDPARFARAALASAGGVWHLALGGRDAPQVNSLLEKSLRMLGDSTAPEAAMVSARLAAELYSRREAPERRRALSEQADAIARDADDPAALLSVLHQRHLVLLSEPSRGCERLRNAEEMLAAASTLGNDEQWCLAFAVRQTELLRDGDLMRADAAAAALSNAARTTGSAIYEEAFAAWTATRAFIDGRFEQALSGVWRFLESAEKSSPEAVALFLPGAVTMLREAGRLDEIERLAARCADAYPWLVMSRAALAQVRFGLGEDEG